MNEDKTTEAVIIAYRVKRMMTAHSWEKLVQIGSFREDVEQLTTTILNQ